VSQPEYCGQYIGDHRYILVAALILKRGARVFVVNSSVCSTVRVGKWTVGVVKYSGSIKYTVRDGIWKLTVVFGSRSRLPDSALRFPLGTRSHNELRLPQSDIRCAGS
jgi:hypothetical protein